MTSKKSWMDVIHPLVNIKHPWMDSSIHPSWINYIHTKGCREGVCELCKNHGKQYGKSKQHKKGIVKFFNNCQALAHVHVFLTIAMNKQCAQNNTLMLYPFILIKF
jgi:hypothetical protein